MRSLSILCLLLMSAPLWAQSPPEVLAPFVDDQTIAVARLRPDKISDAVLAGFEKKLLPAELQSADQWKSPLTVFRERVKEWTAAGGGDIYIIVSFHDVPRQPPFAVLVPKAGKKPEDLVPLAKRWLDGSEALVIGKTVVAGPSETLARIKDAQSSERPDLVQPLAAAPDVALRIAVSPSADARRVYGELLPPFPPNTVSIPSAELFAGVKSLTADLDLVENSSLRVNVHARDAAAAEKWKDAIMQGAAIGLQLEEVKKELPNLNKAAVDPAPIVRGDRVEMVWGAEGERLPRLVSDVVQPLAAKAYAQAATMQSINSLKHIMLAMHNYHDANKSFPLQAIWSKDGDKLLSWRVAILPYVDAKDLYDQFHLNEPWDSEHNRKLIAKMPAVYASNMLPKAKTEQGFTPFVVPVGEGTCFGGKKGTELKDITDGTSNTICVVHAVPSAVEWTKPVDWEVDFKQPAKGWRRELFDPKELLSAGYGDGSVRRIPATTADDTLRWLLQIADGNPIPELP